MITDKERHERAKNFRDMISAREYGIPGTVGSFVDADDVLSELLDRRVYDSEKAIDACEALGIADLIDRPTTTRHGKFKTKYGRETPCCEVCGYSIGDMRWNHCSKCGAAIVDD